MSPERFTLENMFAMELHKYQDVAEEIVNHAIKVKWFFLIELKICLFFYFDVLFNRKPLTIFSIYLMLV